MADRRCPGCGMHHALCLCSHCRPVATALQLVALQHPSEVTQAKGTLRLAKRCLGESLDIFTGETPEDFASLTARIDQRWGLVFPTAGSQPLEQAAGTLPTHWIVIDGTWRKARKIFHANPWLQRIPAYHFATPPPSRYRIRKVPGPNSLSTIEALHYLLQHADPDCQPEGLNQALEAMVERWLAQVPSDYLQRYTR
ncbi:MAG: DTW domain-containing protein [Marinobacter sp.]|nr:DTW domain-containing protein [Marinobacter sp.]